MFGSGENRVCVRERRTSVLARTEVCARKDGYSLDDNICLMLGWFGYIGISATLWRWSPCVWMWWCTLNVPLYRLKCYLAGDVLHGSESQINHVNCHRTCVIHSLPDPPWFVTIGAHDQDWTLVNERGGSEMKKTTYLFPTGKVSTNTAVPRFDGMGCWQQHLQIVQAIVKSNGWSEETAALQLLWRGKPWMWLYWCQWERGRNGRAYRMVFQNTTILRGD